MSASRKLTRQKRFKESKAKYKAQRADLRKKLARKHIEEMQRAGESGFREIKVFVPRKLDAPTASYAAPTP